MTASHNRKSRILIMAGGTGGHVFPGLAVARRMRAEGWEVLWLGTRQGLEADIIPKADIPIRYLTIKGVRRTGILSKLIAPFRLMWALVESLRIIQEYKPQVVLGMGGFVSGPGGIAAWLLGRPLVIHEQNSIAGVTNRYLAKIAKRVLCGFPDSFPKSVPAQWIGNPIREEFFAILPPELRFQNSAVSSGLSESSGSPGSSYPSGSSATSVSSGPSGASVSSGPFVPLRLLIVGGSQGALALNELLPKAIALIPNELRPDIWHQAGANHYELTEAAYREAGIHARVNPFIDDMAEAYAWAHLVICRSGALTVSELATAGVASILIPYPFAVDDHQSHNGRFLERAGAAKLIKQSALDPKILADMIMSLGTDQANLIAMAQAARDLAKPLALTEVVKQCVLVSEGRNQEKPKEVN